MLQDLRWLVQGLQVCLDGNSKFILSNSLHLLFHLDGSYRGSYLLISYTRPVSMGCLHRRDDFFGFDSISGALVPCTAAAASSLLVCSQLKALVNGGGEELCIMEGKNEK